MGKWASPEKADVAIVGAGAAGLATAIFAARRDPHRSIVVLDGATKPGAKILVAGGGRCNVTNAIVAAEDFHGGSRRVIRRVLNAFPVEQTVAFFREIGVTLHEEEHGKLFPDTNESRTVLNALLGEANRLGVRVRSGERVLSVDHRGEHFELVVCEGARYHRSASHAENERQTPPGGERAEPSAGLAARKVVLATGGLSLPRTGSDGAGYRFAQGFGHSLVPPTPALVPFVLEGSFHAPLSGIAQDAEIAIHVEGHRPVRLRGSMLWTHFGVSGPVVLDASRFWHRARLEGLRVTVSANLLPGRDFGSAEQGLIARASSQPRASLHRALSTLLPARVATAVLDRLAIGGQVAMAHLSREDRRKLAGALLAWPLPVRDSRGYQHAEVTAGGIPFDEIDPDTMASRKCPGLHFAGEILDVDGRIGGFNFQWAWSSGFVAGASV